MARRAAEPAHGGDDCLKGGGDDGAGGGAGGWSALARLAALALLTTAAVRKPAEAQTAIPVTSPGMATAPELVAAFAGAGAAAGTAPTAFAYTFEVVLL